MSKVPARSGNLHAAGEKVSIQILTDKFGWEYVGCISCKHRYIANGIQIDLDDETNEAIFGWPGR